MNGHNHVTWEQVKIKSALGRKIRKIAASKLGPSGARKLGEVLGRRKPPPGMVPHPDDGDGDGWTDEDDLKKRRYVGYFRPADLDKIQSPPPYREAGPKTPNSGSRLRRNLALSLFASIEKQARMLAETIENKRIYGKAVVGQEKIKRGIPQLKSRPSKNMAIQQMLDKGVGYRYKRTRPYRNMDHVEGKYEDFVEREFKEIPFGSSISDFFESNPKRISSVVSAKAKKFKKDLEVILSRREFYEESSPSVLNQTLENIQRFFQGELPSDEMLSQENMLRELENYFDGLGSDFSELFEETLNDFIAYGYDLIESQKADEAENDFLKQLAQSSMEQSETFAEIVRIFGLPSLGIIKPQQAKPEVYEKWGLDPNNPEDQILAMQKQRTVFRFDRSVGKYQEGSIFIDTTAVEEGTEHAPDSSGDFSVGRSAEAVLRHEYGHFLDSEAMRASGEFGEATEQQHQILSSSLDEIRNEVKKIIKEALTEDEAVQMLDDIKLAISEARKIEQMGKRHKASLKLANNYIKTVSQIEFQWLSSYGVSDLLWVDPRGTIETGPMREFIAEFFTMATSPNPEIRERIPPQFASIAKNMFNQLGIDWP
jgi:hypothetical protein